MGRSFFSGDAHVSWRSSRWRRTAATWRIVRRNVASEVLRERVGVQEDARGVVHVSKRARFPTTTLIHVASRTCMKGGHVTLPLPFSRHRAVICTTLDDPFASTEKICSFHKDANSTVETMPCHVGRGEDPTHD